VSQRVPAGNILLSRLLEVVEATMA